VTSKCPRRTTEKKKENIDIDFLMTALVELFVCLGAAIDKQRELMLRGISWINKQKRPAITLECSAAVAQISDSTEQLPSVVVVVALSGACAFFCSEQHLLPIEVRTAHKFLLYCVHASHTSLSLSLLANT
jgi:hypothetical protein